jgi:hypothetical protein
VVATAGNNYTGISAFPGSVSGVIRVGAVNWLDRRSLFSNWGPDLSVMAPGQFVISSHNASNSAYYAMDGTSQAAPHVTGLVAHMLTFAPDLTADQIRTYLERNADPVDGQTGFSNLTGWGRINALKTISAVIGDLGGTPASDYVASPVKVSVKLAGAPYNGAVVYLYNCNQGGTINNYVVASITGESYVAMRGDDAIEPESGVAWFSMLRPGYYRVAAATTAMNLEDGKVTAYSAASQPFEVKHGSAAPPVTLSFDFDVMYIQTLATAAGGGNTDTVISVYNSVDGAPLVNDFDGDAFESLMVVRPTKPGAWWIRIRPWNGNSAYSGEYALWVGSPPAARAPGTYAAPGDGGVLGSLTQTRSDASQLIGVNDKIVYGRLTAGTSASGDYYRIVVE